MNYRAWWVLLVTATAFVGAATEARSQHSSRFGRDGVHRDVALGTGADGRTESEVFQIVSENHAASVRLYVRDRDVSTSRGPHDRVCVESVDDRPSPPLALTLVGAPLDVSQGLWSDDQGAQRVRCRLLPASDSYRVWWQGAPGANAVGWPGWTRPPVFDTFEPMTDQDDGAAIERNVQRIMASLPLDGVCTITTVVRPPFHAADGTIGQARWSRPMATVAMMINDAHWLRPDPYQARLDVVRGRGAYRPRPIPANLYEADAYVLPIQMAFTTVDAIVEITSEQALNPEIDPIIQYQEGRCYGDPMIYRARGSEEVPIYGFMHAVLVMPYWREYADSSDELRNFWQTFNNETIIHEMVHLHDHFATLNEIVFQAKGHFDHKHKLIDSNAYASHARRYGLIIDENHMNIDRFFLEMNESVGRAATASVNYFHQALEGAGGVYRNTDLLPAAPSMIGDPAVLDREREAYRRWLNGE